MYCSTKGYYLSLFSSNLQVQFFYFKTSHVIVYQRSNQQCSKKLDISKHLMLLFIYVAPKGAAHSSSFQNISCYCLSEETSVGKITTHTFQNISCYCLSFQSALLPGKYGISKHLMLLFIGVASPVRRISSVFQNISCYCLSFLVLWTLPPQVDFKTSHVIVYQKHFLPKQCHKHYFKTSHVIVYQQHSELWDRH